MNTQEFKRKLTAILSADVEGYSLLMRDDEEATIRTLTTYRTAMTGLIQQYRGRVVDSPGDNILAEFTSAVDAVNCAVEIQRELAERNAELPTERRMQFRIGVNVGDVVEEGERIYGDGVNIAARMEGLAEGGGICISGTAYDQVKHKLGLEYEYLGEQEVKNITEPVPAYRVLSFPGAAAHRVVKAKRAVSKTWRNVVVAIVAVLVVATAVAVWHFYFRPPSIEPASVERMAFPLPDKPSIAVLPFVNMSGDPEQEYFSDGLTEEIISALSRVPKLFVIARNSTFTYKGKPVKVQQVSEELGVRYVLEGSVRKAGDRVRITAQLIDATIGHHLWSERYDRDLRDIFALQDEITIKIITSLQVELTEGESARLAAKGTDNLEAYIKYLQANELARRRTKEDIAVARQIAKEAVVLDPTYAPPYTVLAWTHMIDIWLKSTKSPRQSLTQAIRLAQKSIALDDSFPRAHGLLGWLYTMARQYDKGIAECERAVALNPNSLYAYSSLGIALRYAGRHEEAVRACEKSVRLNPFPRAGQLTSLGMAYFFTGRYDKAIEACKKAINIEPNDPLNHLGLVSAYIGAGREDEARAEIEVVLTIDPKYSLRYIAEIIPYKNPSDKERAIETLRRAGLPETPPLPLPDKPSIAVLPFVNMSGDPEQEYFSDGITEEIITALSKTPTVFVIARTSSFKYKGKEVDVRTVGRELGVRYVLEGSIRKSEDRLRVTAQLVEAKTRHHLWAERWDRELKDIFEIQDEITMKILTGLQVKLTMGEHARRVEKGASNVQAYLKVLQARAIYLQGNKEDNLLARQLLEEAIALDPRYPVPYVLLGWTHVSDVFRRWSKSPKESMARVSQLAQKVLAMDDSRSGPHVQLGFVYLFRRQHEKAIAEMEQAVALAPNADRNYAFLAGALNYAGRSEEAIPLLKKALRRNPQPESWMLYFLGHVYILKGRYKEAIAACEEAVKIAPRNTFAHVYLTSAYSLSGRDEEARTQAEELIRINPKYCIRSGKGFYKNLADAELINNALRKAGLPDCPPRRSSK